MSAMLKGKLQAACSTDMWISKTLTEAKDNAKAQGEEVLGCTRCTKQARACEMVHDRLEHVRQGPLKISAVVCL